MNKKSAKVALRLARRQLIRHAVQASKVRDLEAKYNWETRREYIDQQLEKIEMLEEELSVPRRVFISFCVNTGQLYYDFLEKRLREVGFEVVNGFKPVRGAGGNVLSTILAQLRRSTIYLGILSKEIQVLEDNIRKWSPGVWTVEEKGMALSLEKPFVLMIHEDIHEDFWRKTSPLKIHIFFNDNNFYDKAEEVVEAVNDRYDEYALKKLHKQY